VLAEDGIVNIGDAVAQADKLSTSELLIAAQQEAIEAGPDDPEPHLVALNQRPTPEVFGAATELIAGTDPAERVFGIRILRELGEADDTGRRPFSDQAVPLLRELLRQERDARALAWIISALSYNAARESLPEVLRFAEHSDAGVRFAVAAALPSLMNPEQAEPAAAAALLALCKDDNPETRYYALYALLDEVAGIDPDQLAVTLGALRDDPDEQVRAMARTGRVDA
jgi:HEAT repeat protein